ncbi:MAG: 2-hydroxyacyl-CoA dehydratase, partial [Thermoleophilia bacterium]|nr:2-hydroxyacyl-CoA dehydratase [Thermoleophilia bacterium]
EGIRDYRHRVGPLDGGEPGPAGDPGTAGAAGPPRAAGTAGPAMRDPLDSLARAYLLNRRPAAFMRGSSRRRLEYALDLIRDFDVAGVLWYELQCCEFYDQESYFFQKELAERGIPMLIVESNYHGLDTGPLRTRLDAFVETMTGGLLDA